MRIIVEKDMVLRGVLSVNILAILVPMVYHQNSEMCLEVRIEQDGRINQDWTDRRMP